MSSHVSKICVALAAFASLLCPARADAQWDYGEEPLHWSIDVLGGLNSDGYEAEVSATWWVVPSFGLRMALGIDGEVKNIGDWGWCDDYYYDYYYDDDYATRLKFMTSLELVSPALAKWGTGTYSLHLFGNPGVCLSPGAEGSRNAKWFCWQLRGGLQLDIDIMMIRMGYGYSDFNLYSGNPWSHHGYDKNREHNTHTGFVSLGIRF